MPETEHIFCEVELNLSVITAFITTWENIANQEEIFHCGKNDI